MQAKYCKDMRHALVNGVRRKTIACAHLEKHKMCGVFS
jgi:hypothetical protein